MENKQLKGKELIDKFLRDNPDYNGGDQFIRLIKEQRDYYKYHFMDLFSPQNKYSKKLLAFLENNPSESAIVNFIIDKLNEKIEFKKRVPKHQIIRNNK